jgi:hypothetical protein
MYKTAMRASEIYNRTHEILHNAIQHNDTKYGNIKHNNK